MSLVISLNQYRQSGLGDGFVANRYLDGLNLALQTYMQGSMAGTPQGMDALRLQVQPLIEPLESAELLRPEHLVALREFSDPALRGELTQVQVEDLAKRVAHLSNEIQRTKAPVFVNGDNSPTRRLGRMTGQVAARSIMPPALRDGPISTTLGRTMEYPDVKTKHVRAAILFTDFSGFSKQSKGAKSEYIINRLNEYFRRLIPIAQKTGGIVNKLVGDAIVAYWIDSSNNSLQAVRAALAMQEAVRNIIEDLKAEVMKTADFQNRASATGKRVDQLSEDEILDICRTIDPLIPLMKVGINTGWVSYGRLGAEPPYYSEITVIGDAVNTAARMEAACKPGQICISQATQSDLPPGMFDLNDLGKVEAKNIGMVEAFSVVRENRLFIVNGGGNKAAKVLHGRDEEIRQLTEAFMYAVEDHSPRFMMLIAKPGEGKSTIANHFLGIVKSEEFAVNDVDIIYARGEDQPEIEPYHVIANALRMRAGVDMGSNQEDSERRRQRQIENEMKVRAFIESAFTGTAKDRDMTARILGHFLEVPFEGSSDQMDYLIKNHADLNVRTIEAIVDVFEGLAVRRPVIFVVDDMQWTDLGTRSLMHTLLTRLKHSPLMVLGMRRPEMTDPFPADEPDWYDNAFKGDIIDLNALNANDLKAIVYETLGADVEPSVIQDILDRATYNPLFVREIATAIKGGMSLDQVPTTVHDLFQAQLTRLPDEHLELLKRAAIVGRDFEDTDLVALGIAEPDHLLPELIEGDFIIKVGDGGYRFRHDLLREALTGSVNQEQGKENHGMMEEAELRAYHAVFADHLVSNKSQQYAKIAAHYHHASRVDDSAQYYMKAAEAAENQGSFAAAASFYEKTYQLTKHPVQKAKALFGWDDVLVAGKRFADELQLLEYLENLSHLGANDRDLLAMISYHKAQALAQNNRIEDAEVEMERGLSVFRTDDAITEARCDLLHLRCVIRRRFEADKGILEADAEHLRVAIALQDNRRQGIALVDVAGTEMNQGRYSESLANFSEAMKLLKPYGTTERMYLRALNGVSTALFLMGDFHKSLGLAREGLKSLSKLKDYSYELNLLNITFAQAAIYSGQYVDEAIDAMHELTGKSSADNGTIVDFYGYVYLAMAYEKKNDWRNSEAAAKTAIVLSKRLSSESEIGDCYTVLARSMRGAGQYTEALEASNSAMKIYRQNGGIPQFDAEALLTHIEVLVANSRLQDAASYAEEAKSMVDDRARKITNIAHRRSFLHSWPNNEIVSLYESLRVVTTRQLPERVRSIIQGLHTETADVLPAKFDFMKDVREGMIAVKRGEKASIAATILNAPVMDVLASVLTKEFRIDENPGDFIKGIWAEDISWRPFFSRDGVFHARVSWNMTGKGVMKKLILSLFGEHGHGNELLQDRIYERDGGVVIELQKASTSEVASSTGEIVRVDPNCQPRPYQFGQVQFILIPQAGNKTLLALEMETALYTQNPENFLNAFVRAMAPVRHD